MDLFTLGAALLFAFSLLGAETVIHSGSVDVALTTAPQLARMDKMSIDKSTLEDEFQSQLNDIVTTESIVHPAEIRSSRDVGIGMALAQAAKVESIAFALQRELGYRPDELHLALFVEDGKLRGLITGTNHNVGSFRQIMTPAEGEGVIHFVRRCALWGGSKLAPYSTALYLMEEHIGDGDFTDALALIEQTKTLLPPAPLNYDRALLDNLNGLIALFKNDPHAAKTSFDAAIASDPSNSVPILNAAFAEVQYDDYRAAAERMRLLIESAPPSDKVLLGTAYVTWGAALLGLHDPEGADRMLTRAAQVYPGSATAMDLWAEAKQEKGDLAAAKALRDKALSVTATFENYVEVAALYFHLSWRNDEPMIRNKFGNPGVLSFH